MKIEYKVYTNPPSLRTVHWIIIGREELKTTRAKEVLSFARVRIADKYVWKELKEAVRLGEFFEVHAGDSPQG